MIQLSRRRKWHGLSRCLIGWLVVGWLTHADARVRWSSPGSYRVRSIHTPAYQVDETGATVPDLSWLRHRLRLQPRVEVGPFAVFLELDVLTGQIYGDTTRFGDALTERRQPEPSNEYDGWTTVEPRHAWMELRFTHFDIRAGQMSRHWGLGLYAHDGDDRNRPPSWVLRPGDAWNGDIIDSVEVTVRPFATVSSNRLNGVSVRTAIGYVYQDENASTLGGDEASEFEAALGYTSRRMQWAIHYLERTQTDRSGQFFNEEVFDAHLHWTIPLFLSNAELLIAGEALAISGETSRRTTGNGQPVSRRGYGGVIRAAIRWLCPRIAVGLDAGFLSGDDPKTSRDESLTSDPDYRVGFVFFREALRSTSMQAGQVLLAEDEEVSNALGSRNQPTDGALRNALFFSPGLTWRPLGLELGL
ncbi:MAG: hypothetical protein VX589_07955, partial [Myxococcota bacterium]|nr:hypothetical protein [Myxococcota bacterium]